MVGRGVSLGVSDRAICSLLLLFDHGPAFDQQQKIAWITSSRNEKTDIILLQLKIITLTYSIYVPSL